MNEQNENINKRVKYGDGGGGGTNWSKLWKSIWLRHCDDTTKMYKSNVIDSKGDSVRQTDTDRKEKKEEVREKEIDKCTENVGEHFCKWVWNSSVGIKIGWHICCCFCNCRSVCMIQKCKIELLIHTLKNKMGNNTVERFILCVCISFILVQNGELKCLKKVIPFYCCDKFFFCEDVPLLHIFHFYTDFVCTKNQILCVPKTFLGVFVSNVLIFAESQANCKRLDSRNIDNKNCFSNKCIRRWFIHFTTFSMYNVRSHTDIDFQMVETLRERCSQFGDCDCCVHLINVVYVLFASIKNVSISINFVSPTGVANKWRRKKDDRRKRIAKSRRNWQATIRTENRTIFFQLKNEIEKQNNITHRETHKSHQHSDISTMRSENHAAAASNWYSHKDSLKLFAVQRNGHGFSLQIELNYRNADDWIIWTIFSLVLVCSIF